MKKRFRIYSLDYPSDLPLACHEASHACHMIACADGDGKVVLKASMGPDEITGSIAECEYQPEFYEKLDDFLKIVTCYVGEASDEEFFGLDLTDQNTFDQNDATELAYMIDTTSAQEMLKRARAEASAFVRRYETAIRAIGARLCRVGEMSGAEIASMMKKYPPRGRVKRRPSKIH